MFERITGKLRTVFSGLAGKRMLTEENIRDAVREVRLALLEADVGYAVAKTFVKNVKEKVVGGNLMKSVTPGQQFIKIVHDELVTLMGGEEAKIDLSVKPSVIMVCGLQGSGKTTHCAKLAHFIAKEYKKKSLLVACDLQRPAAVEQLKTLGQQIDTPVFFLDGVSDPLAVARQALTFARQQGVDVVIVDTAGRLHIDDDLMKQLSGIKEALTPQEILFVANAATGQDAVKSAQAFSEHIEITGTILTMMDGDARGGAAISITEVTKKPLKFEGIGEKVGDLQLFNPVSLADRVLGMGDTINLVKQAQEHVDEEDAKSLEEKLRKASFTFADYLKQMQAVKKMGSLKSLMGMLPGMSGLQDMDMSEGEVAKIEAIILSMTFDERKNRVDLGNSRRKRISRGSGTSLDDVNRLVKSFKRAKQFFKNMPNLQTMKKQMGGATLWR